MEPCVLPAVGGSLFERSMRLFCFCVLALAVAGSSWAGTYFKKYFPAGLEARRSGDPARAVRIWKSCLARKELTTRERVKLLYALAVTYSRAGRREKALVFARKALRLAPSSTRLLKLVDVLEKPPAGHGGRSRPSFAERFEDASSSLQAGLENERSYDGSGTSLFEEAAPVFEEAIRRGYRAGFAHYGIAVCMLETGKDEKLARSHLEKALAASYKGRDLYFRLGTMALKDGNADEAVRLLENCDRDGGATPEQAEALVRAYALKGGKLDERKILELVGKVAQAKPDLAAGLASRFADRSLRSRIEKTVSAFRNASAGTRSSRGSGRSDRYRSRYRGSSASRRTAVPTRKQPKPRQARKREKPKTQIEKNYERYNELRYRQYLEHLSRLQRGLPSSWSGAIPTKPEKKKK